MSIDDLPTYHCLSIRKRILLQSQLKAAAVNPQTTPYPPTTSEMLGQNNNAIVAAPLEVRKMEEQQKLQLSLKDLTEKEFPVRLINVLEYY